MRDIQAINFQVIREVTSHLTDQIGEWAGRVVNVIQDLPFHMQNNSLVAYGVIASVNAIFFSLIHLVINQVEKESDNTNSQDKIFNFVVFDVLVTGSVALAFNLALSKVTQYPLSKTTLAIITTSYIALRLIFNQGGEVEENFPSEEVKEKKEAEMKSEVEHETGKPRKLVNDTKKNLDEFQEKEKARAEKKKIADEKERASLEEEKKKLAEEKEKAQLEEEKKKLADEKEKSQLEVEKQKLADEKTRLEEEKKKIAEDQKKAQEEAEKKKLADEQEKVQVDADRKQLAELLAKEKRDADEKKAAQEKAKAEQEAKAKKLADEKAKADREAAEKKLADEKEQARQDAIRKKDAEERARRLEEAAKVEQKRQEALKQAQEALLQRQQAAAGMTPPPFEFARIKKRYADDDSILITCQTNADLQKLWEKLKFGLPGINIEQECIFQRVGSQSIKTGATQLDVRILDHGKEKPKFDLEALFKQLSGTATPEIEDKDIVAKDETLTKNE